MIGNPEEASPAPPGVDPPRSWIGHCHREGAVAAPPGEPLGAYEGIPAGTERLRFLLLLLHRTACAGKEPERTLRRGAGGDREVLCARVSGGGPGGNPLGGVRPRPLAPEVPSRRAAGGGTTASGPAASARLGGAPGGDRRTHLLPGRTGLSARISIFRCRAARIRCSGG